MTATRHAHLIAEDSYGNTLPDATCTTCGLTWAEIKTARPTKAVKRPRLADLDPITAENRRSDARRRRGHSGY